MVELLAEGQTEVINSGGRNLPGFFIANLSLRGKKPLTS